MSAVNKSAKALSKELDRLHIHTASLVFRDPDSEAVVSMRRGDPCWLSGALRMAEQEVTDNWVTIKRPSCDDDP